MDMAGENSGLVWAPRLAARLAASSEVQLLRASWRPAIPETLAAAILHQLSIPQTQSGQPREVQQWMTFFSRGEFTAAVVFLISGRNFLAGPAKAKFWREKPVPILPA